MILVTVILMDLLTGMEFDLFVPSFPELQSQFNLSPFWVEALLSANFIGYCLSLFFVGGLADRYGRKPIISLGIITFVFGSLLCLWGGSQVSLLLGRFLQGMGIAAPAILSFLIIADIYPLKKQRFLMAMLNVSMNTATAFAPVIGSYVTLYFRWQGNFIILLSLGLIILIMTLFFIPVYKIILSQEKVIPLQGYMTIFKSKPLMLLIAHLAIMFAPYWIFVGMSPLLYMKSLGVSLSHFGYYQGVFALLFAIGSLFFGMIVNRYDQKNLLSIANLIFIFSLISVAAVSLLDNAKALLITLAFIPFVIGQIIPSTILYPLSLNFMPEAKGRVSALIQGMRLIFSALSLQVAGYFYQGTFLNIGIIIISFIFAGIITLFYIIKNEQIMKFS